MRRLAGLVLAASVGSAVAGCGSTADVSTEGVAEKQKEVEAARAKSGQPTTRDEQ